jgi:hypothetical protein
MAEAEVEGESFQVFLVSRGRAMLGIVDPGAD